MTPARYYVEMARHSLQVDSDVALAAHLGVTRITVARYRNGTLIPSTQVCIRLARICGVPEALIVLEMLLLSAKDEDSQRLFRAMLSDYV